MHEYKAKVLNVVDGDTMDVAVDLGFRVQTVQRIRLVGVDTPELHASDPAKRSKAAKAHEYTEHWVAAVGGNVVIRSQKPGGGDKYGRWLAEVFGSEPMGRSLNAALIAEGLAVAYDGGAKES